MKGRLLFTTIVVLAITLSGKAQIPKPDTLDIPSSEIISGFDTNLDSLLTLWYVQQSLSFEDFDSATIAESDSILLEFPDSVYIQRLESLPFIIDLSYNKTVRNFIKLYTDRRRDRVRIMLTLSEYYFPMFEEIFDRKGLPQELKYMAVIESALNPRAVSRAGATGMWQFMYYTGKKYGLTINSLVDERRDPYKSTLAAAEFLSDLYAMYKDWHLVIAAYNCGPGNVNKAIRRSGGKRNYWDIYYYLPRETRGYVPAFIAAAYVMNYYDKHNLQPVPVDFAIHNDTVLINHRLHLNQVSEVLQIPVDYLRDLNPQYKYDIIPDDRDEYILRLPRDNVMSFIDLQDSIYAFKDSVYFNTGKLLVTPVSSSYSPPRLPSDKYTRLSYTVKPGDNLGFISMWYNVRVSDLKYWNNIRSNMIRGGQKLTVYVPNGEASKYQDVDQLSFAEKQARIGKSVSGSTSSAPSPESSMGSDSAGYVTYTVRNGDSLWEIAKKFPGVSDSDIARLNGMKYGETIQPGQVLKIKKEI